MKPGVAFQGELGAYSEEAVVRLFGEDAHPVPCRDFHAVGEAVTNRDAVWGLLPIENSIAGSVVGSYDVLATFDLTIHGEVVIPIHHCLLGLPGAKPSELVRVLSHPVALAQCTRFLRACSGLEVLAVYDTAGAAMEVASGGDPTRAAIAGRQAASRYGLEILAADIEDRTDNQTRFLLVTRSHDEPALPEAVRDDSYDSIKIAAMVEVPNEPGALYSILRPFADRQINLSKLEARPASVPWTYRFFLELEVQGGGAVIREVLGEVKAKAERVRVLGCFPGFRQVHHHVGIRARDVCDDER